MSKYEALKEWKLIRARVSRPCDRCEETIEPGSNYYAERLPEKMAKPPSLRLGSVHEECYELRASK